MVSLILDSQADETIAGYGVLWDNYVVLLSSDLDLGILIINSVF